MRGVLIPLGSFSFTGTSFQPLDIISVPAYRVFISKYGVAFGVDDGVRPK